MYVVLWYIQLKFEHDSPILLTTTLLCTFCFFLRTNMSYIRNIYSDVAVMFKILLGNRKKKPVDFFLPVAYTCHLFVGINLLHYPA